MKSRTFILGMALFVSGGSSAIPGPCTTEINGLTKTLAAKDAGSGPTSGATGRTQEPTGSAQTSADRRYEPGDSRARQHLPRTCVVKTKASLPLRSRPGERLPGLTGWMRLARRWLSRELSTRRGRKPNAWKLCDRPRNSPAPIELSKRGGHGILGASVSIGANCCRSEPITVGHIGRTASSNWSHDVISARRLRIAVRPVPPVGRPGAGPRGPCKAAGP